MNKTTLPKRKKSGRQRVLAVDFDGVIHDQSTREPYPDAPDAIAILRNKGFKIIVFSCRANTPTGKQMIIDFLRYHMIGVHDVTATKPVADLYIDDRAILHTDWETTLEKIEERLVKT